MRRINIISIDCIRMMWQAAKLRCLQSTAQKKSGWDRIVVAT